MVDITTGGIRDRLIRDAAAKYLQDALGLLHWFESANPAKVTFVDHAVAPGTEVPLGTMSLSMDNTPVDDEMELGSNFGEYRYVLYVDLYGHDEDSGRQISGDVRDILLGKHPSIGCDFPILPVYDTTTSPTPIDPAFEVLIEKVEADRAIRDINRPWQEFWFVVKFELVEDR